MTKEQRMTGEQLRKVNAIIEEALQLSFSEPTGLLCHLLEMASLEVSQRMKSQTGGPKLAA